MCRRVNCSRCSKPTFAGCGMHVEQVLGSVPKSARCKCSDEPQPVAGDRRPWWQPFK